MARPTTLWGGTAAVDAALWDFTAGRDRPWDARLLRWDVLGSLGHIEGLRRAGLVNATEHARLRRLLRRALREVDAGRLAVGAGQEDVHTAVEAWLTRRARGAGERLHTGRSRNDQVATDLRLWLKDALLEVHAEAEGLAGALLGFAGRHRTALWPGYTHTRRAMPSSAALWAAAVAEGLSDSLAGLAGFWPMLDRSPLGSAAGFGAPLPIDRRVPARALGFDGPDPNVAMVQPGRGKLEAAALFWCLQIGHEARTFAADVILLSSEEFGFLVLPAGLATGSSIMPHKRNPDLFELARGEFAALEGDLAAVLAIRGGLTSGYHRDWQLLKEPLMRGVERTRAALRILAHAVPRLEVDRRRALAALDRGTLATDEVMRRVEAGTPFRAAYREVKAELARGESFAPAAPAGILRRRSGRGGVGNPDLAGARMRLRARKAWRVRESGRFARTLRGLAGSRA
jgi:argininosuccinate lyase